MNSPDLQQYPHRRLNPLTGEWVLVSPHRTTRPWLGKVETPQPQEQPRYDPGCYLCPGNSRAGGIRNPQYPSTFVFDNDYPALLPAPPEITVDESGLLVARSEAGVCRVVCFSPCHDLTIPRMSEDELANVVDVWAEQYKNLASLPWVHHIQVFENRGALMGASNPHPHCQIWANASAPNEPAKEGASFESYFNSHGGCLLCDYLQLELRLAARMVCQNDDFAVVVPYWAIWPFETLLLSKRHFPTMTELSNGERRSLAGILKRITTLYDNLFETSFPYSMGFHQGPADGKEHRECHFHAHYYPPLLRSATVRKFMVGYELLNMPQRDITPETAAARLRDAGEIHYLDRINHSVQPTS
jgi:UDPglucose--hexose-1-phosphate uridylyltransferase